MDRNMSKKEVMYLDLEKEVARLNKERAILVQETNTVIKNLSNLKEEQMAIEKSSKDIVTKAKLEAETIIKKAKDIENDAIAKKSTIEIKLGNIETQKKELNDLIKSNEGLEKNLKLSKEDIDNLKSKLLKAVEVIKETLK